MINLLDLTTKELEDFIIGLGLPKFRAAQIRSFLYKGVFDFDQMHNVPKDIREKLKDLEAKGEITSGKLNVLDSRESKDGSTKKCLFEFTDGNAVETVLMRYKYGNSVCISTQAGCRMGCRFCASTLLGLKRNLTPGEMIAQILSVTPPGERIGHIVLMGTGEPFDNYENVKKLIELVGNPKELSIGHRSITISTCGIVPVIRKFTEELPQVNLAISLHGPNNRIRSATMPVNDAYPLEVLLPAVAEHAAKTGRRVTFEYTLVADTNDSLYHAEELAALIKANFNNKKNNGGLAHINLIPLNKVEETGLESSTRAQAEMFKARLTELGIPATIRREMGADIDAACGQLRLKHEEKA